MQSLNPPSQIIFDIHYDTRIAIEELKTMISDLIDVYAPELVGKGYERAFVHELIRQIFDVMTDDYSRFTTYIAHWPNFNRFVGLQSYCKHETTIRDLTELCHRIANSFYFHLRDEGLFRLTVNGEFPFILNHPDDTFILLQYTGQQPLQLPQ